MFLYPFHIFLQPFASIPGGLGRLVKDIVDFIAKYVQTNMIVLQSLCFVALVGVQLTFMHANCYLVTGFVHGPKS